MKKNVSKIEQAVIFVAFAAAGIQLALIAYGAWRLGLVVPTCVTNVKPFDQAQFISHAPDRYEAHVVAKMWAFEPPLIRVPKGSTIDFYIASKDINHGFHIDRTNVNLNASPGVVNYAQAHFKKPGVYSIVCNEYCGSGHQLMHAQIEVTDSADPGSADGLTNNGAPQPAADLSNHPALAILNAKGCLACHSRDGSSSVGPSLKGLYGRPVQFIDGTSLAAVDDAFLRESIQEPQKKVEKGFSPIMPKMPLTDDEVNQIIDYIKQTK